MRRFLIISVMALFITGAYPHQKPMMLMAWLQSSSGLIANGEVPVWGVFAAIIGAVAAFAAVRQQMSSHEKADDQRFSSQDRMLEEIRADVKTILGKHE